MKKITRLSLSHFHTFTLLHQTNPDTAKQIPLRTHHTCPCISAIHYVLI